MLAQRRSATVASVALGLVALLVSCSKVPLLAPTSAAITLIPEANSVSLNSQASIVATVILGGVASSGSGTGGTSTGRPGAGNPVQNGTQVTFTTSLGTIQPSVAYTHDGQVQVTFLSGNSSGVATITAYSGGASAQTTLKVGTAAVKTITLSAAPQSLPAAGGAAQVVANVVDDGGSPIGGVLVTFSTDHGTVTPSALATDSNGNATTVLSTIATAKVTATAGSVSSTALTVNVSVRGLSTFTVNPPSTTAGTPVTFTLTLSSGANVSNVHLDFGDGDARDLGAIGATTTIAHSYNSPGNYTATAAARDATGDSGTLSTSVIVGALGVTLAAAPNPSATDTPTTYTVGGVGSAVVDHYVWSWDDGTAPYTTTAPQTTHTFSSRGSKTTRVDVIGVGGGTLGSAQLSITVQ